MSRNEELTPEIVVAPSDWEFFLSSLERLMALHRKVLVRLKELKVRNEALRTELRSAMALPTLRSPREGASPEEGAAIRWCRHCGREINLSARFCDSCGRAVAVMLCSCGRELGRFDRFCDGCGRPVGPS